MADLQTRGEQPLTPTPASHRAVHSAPAVPHSRSATMRHGDPTVRLFAALADPIRLDIVRQLADGTDVCACDFDVCTCHADAGGRVTQPTVSHHLRVLREAGVVQVEREGTHIHYSLDPAAVERLSAFVRVLSPR